MKFNDTINQNHANYVLKNCDRMLFFTNDLIQRYENLYSEASIVKIQIKIYLIQRYRNEKNNGVMDIRGLKTKNTWPNITTKQLNILMPI